MVEPKARVLRERPVDALKAFSYARQELEESAAFYAQIPIPKALEAAGKALSAYLVAKAELKAAARDHVRGGVAAEYLQGCPAVEKQVKLDIESGTAKRAHQH